MSEAERDAAMRVHRLDCWQHMRNIFLKHMSAAQAKHVGEQLQPQLEKFSAWERMSTEFSQLLRAAYREFHHGQRYYKGKGKEFWEWLRREYPAVFTLHLERAEGGRQDLDFDAAVPLYIMRPYFVEFLHGLVFGAEHSNILEDFLYTVFRSEEFIAMCRANALVDLILSRPLRFLAGKSHEMGEHGWSPVSNTRALDAAEQLLVRGAADGSCFLDEHLDPFQEIAAEQPVFAAWRKHTYEEQTVRAADGVTKHVKFERVRDELFNPADGANATAGVRSKTIE